MTIDSLQSEATDSANNISTNSLGQAPPLTDFVTYFADRQTAIPPGVRVVQPPGDTRQAIRGNLYAIVELFQDGTEPTHINRALPQKANVQEEILATIQRTYYTAKGTQSNVLTETMQAAYRALDEHNRHNVDNPLHAGIICVAFLKDQLSIATSGSALTLVVTDERIEQFPSTLQSPESAVSLQEPEIEVLRRKVHDGALFFIGGGSWLEQLSLRRLVGVVAHADVTYRFDAMNELRQLAQAGMSGTEQDDSHAPALLVVLGATSEQKPISTSPYSQSFVSPSATDSGPAQSPSTHYPSTSYPATEGLPTAINAAPPLSDMPQTATEEASSRGLSSTSSIPDVITGPISAVQPAANAAQSPPDRYEPIEQIPTLSSEAELGTQFNFDEQGGFAQEAFSEDSFQQARTSSSKRRQTGPLGSVLAVLQQSKEFWVDLFSNQNNAQGRNPKRASAPFKMPLPARGDRARLYILSAVLVAFLIPVIVTVIYLQNGADIRQQAEALIEQAKVDIIDAKNAFDLGDKGVARTELNEAQRSLDQAVERIGYTPELNLLLADVQTELQDVLQVTPLYGLVEPLVLFPTEALPHRLIVADQDLYVLDIGQQMLLRFQLDETRTFVSDPAGEIVLQEGSEVDGVRVGRLVDMAWQEPVPGFEDKAHLIVLDRNNQVFRYNQQVEGATRLVFGKQESWQFPSQIQSYLGRIYITDEGPGEIYRYDPGNYEGEPMLWLDEQTRVNLAGLSSMRIDGDIWMLFDNGMILRYQQRIQVPFSLDSSINIVENPVDMFVDSQSTSFIYLADATQERILVYDKDGTYQYQFKAADGSPLRDLRGLFVDEVAGEMYLLTQSALFQHPLPR